MTRNPYIQIFKVRALHAHRTYERQDCRSRPRCALSPSCSSPSRTTSTPPRSTSSPTCTTRSTPWTRRRSRSLAPTSGPSSARGTARTSSRTSSRPRRPRQPRSPCTTARRASTTHWARTTCARCPRQRASRPSCGPRASAPRGACRARTSPRSRAATGRGGPRAPTLSAATAAAAAEAGTTGARRGRTVSRMAPPRPCRASLRGARRPLLTRRPCCVGRAAPRRHGQRTRTSSRRG